jgi:hypothetical protein
MEFHNEKCKQVLAYDMNPASPNFADQFRYKPCSNMYVVPGRYFELLAFLAVLWVCMHTRDTVCLCVFVC